MNERDRTPHRSDDDGAPDRHQHHEEGTTSHSQKEGGVRGGQRPRVDPASAPVQGAFGDEVDADADEPPARDAE